MPVDLVEAPNRLSVLVEKQVLVMEADSLLDRRSSLRPRYCGNSSVKTKLPAAIRALIRMSKLRARCKLASCGIHGSVGR